LIAVRAAALSSQQGSNQLPTQRVMVRGMWGGWGGFPQGYRGESVKLTIHPHLLQRLRMGAAEFFTPITSLYCGA